MRFALESFGAVFVLLYPVTLLAAVLTGLVLRKVAFPVPQGPRFGSVDALRGLLAISVVCHHFWIWTQLVRFGEPWSAATLAFANQLGAGSVGLFFMITGLVFYPTALKGMGSVSWPALYIGRVFRIVPLVAVSFGLVSLVIALRTGARPESDYLSAAFHWISAHREIPIMGYGDSGHVNAFVLWSLWQEWIFYAFVLPLVALGHQAAKLAKVPSWTVPAALLLFGLAAGALAPNSPAHYWPLFAIGMLAYELCAREPIRVWLTGRTAGVIAAAAMLLAVVFTATPFGPALPAFALFFFCAAAGNRFGGVLALPGAVVIGEVSFGIYLLHGILLNLLFVDGRAFVEGVPLALLPLLMPALAVLIVLVAAGTYLLVERPAWRFGKRLGARLNPVPAGEKALAG